LEYLTSFKRDCDYLFCYGVRHISVLEYLTSFKRDCDPVGSLLEHEGR